MGWGGRGGVRDGEAGGEERDGEGFPGGGRGGRNKEGKGGVGVQ
jgi:hypothetical protein